MASPSVTPTRNTDREGPGRSTACRCRRLALDHRSRHFLLCDHAAGTGGCLLGRRGINTGAMLAKEGMKANMGEPSLFTRSVGAAMVGFLFSEFLIIAGVGIDGLVGSYIDMLEEEFVVSASRGWWWTLGLGAVRGR